MSLDICLFDDITLEQAVEHFYKKYDIPEKMRDLDIDDISDWLLDGMSKSDDELFASGDHRDRILIEYRNLMQEKLNTPASYDNLVGVYYTPQQNAMRKIAFACPDGFTDVGEIDNFHIGYHSFFYIRKEILKACGGRYYTIDDGSTFGQDMIEYPHNWHYSKEGKAALNFFLHSDCDGEFSEAQIHLLAKYFKDNHIRSKLSRQCTANCKPQALDFLDYVQKCSHHRGKWIFL